MTYKIPNLPSSKAYREELADFWEVQTLRNESQYYSYLEIAKALSIGFDEIVSDGLESEDDLLLNHLDDVFIELDGRYKSISSIYPFEFGKYSIRLKEEISIAKDVYLFLLLCTRFNMKDDKVQNGVDATLIFEKLCAVVAKNYFGKSADSFVFGTAEQGNFETKIKDLIRRIGEGQGFKNPNNNVPTKNDDAVDVVVWKEFGDKRIGKLIGFGQCKTGTSWERDIHELKPSKFCESWLQENVVLKPIPIIFICDTLTWRKNFHTIQTDFLVFNRFRIMEYLPEELAEDLISEIRNWLEDALIKIQ